MLEKFNPANAPKNIKRNKSRRDEIVSACEKLYATLNFKDISIKSISMVTSFSRPSIYNYFNTKEEIFLALLAREYHEWAHCLRLIPAQGINSIEMFAKALARSLANRKTMLKLLAMNHYDMESNSGPEQLTMFKIAYGETIDAMTWCLSSVFPDMTTEKKQVFIYVFFPFMFGIYPYTTTSDKQRMAMAEAGINFSYKTVDELVADCVINLLKNRQ